MEFTQDDPESTGASPLGAIRQWLTGVFSEQRLPFLAIAAVCAAANTLLPSQVWHFPNGTLAMVLCGGLTTQISLLATYAAFYAKATWESRLYATLLLLAAWASYSLGMQTAATGRGTMPLEAAIAMLVIAAVGFVAHCALLIAIKRILRIGIVHRDDNLDDVALRPLSISALMTVTTAVAIGYCLIRWGMPLKSLGGPIFGWQVFVLGAVLVCLCSSLSALTALVILAPKLSTVSVLLFLATQPAWPWVYSNIVRFLFHSTTRNYLIYYFWAGQFFFFILAFGSVRALGYHWQRKVT